MKILSVLLFLFTYPSIANLGDKIEEISDMLPELSSDKETIRQEITFTEATPFLINYVRETEKSKDGKISTLGYEVNLGLCDLNDIEIKPSKNKMSVFLKVKEGKFIKSTKDGEPKGYTNKLEILAEDIDGARDLKDELSEAITMANEAWISSLAIPEDLEAQKNWVIEAVGDVSNGKNVMQQVVGINENYSDYLIIQQKDNKNDITYSVPLGEINTEKSSVKTNKETAALRLSTTKKLKVIKEDKDGQITFSNKVDLLFSSPDQALATSMAIKKMHDASLNVMNERNTTYERCDNCAVILSEQLKNFGAEEATIEGECNVNVSTIGKSEKSFAFNWADVDGNKIRKKNGSKGIEIEIPIKNKKNYISLIEKGKKAYKNKLELVLADLEAGREVFGIVRQLSESCNLDLEIADEEFMIEALAKENESLKFTQSLEVVDDCKWSYEQSEGEKFKSFEFNLFDLTPGGISSKISSKELSITLKTKGKEKIITMEDEKGKTSFTNQVKLYFSTVEDLRIAEMTLEFLIEDCE